MSEWFKLVKFKNGMVSCYTWESHLIFKLKTKKNGFHSKGTLHKCDLDLARFPPSQISSKSSPLSSLSTVSCLVHHFLTSDPQEAESDMGFILHTTDFIVVRPLNRKLTEDTEWLIGFGARKWKRRLIKKEVVGLQPCKNTFIKGQLSMA